MIEALPARIDSVGAQRRADRRTSTLSYVIVVGAGLLVALAGFRGFAAPFSLAFAMLICGGALILYKPIAGVYLTVFFSVLGDKPTMLGYPFDSNFSSHESILYIANALTFTPIDFCLALTAAGWFAHVAGARAWHLVGRPLAWPVVTFGLFVLVGLAYGVFIRGGDRTVAIFEARPLLYLVAMYLLASSLFTRASHYVSLAWVVVLAVSLQNLLALRYYFALSPADRQGLEGLTEHPASLLYAWLFLLTFAVWLTRGSSRWARFLLLLAAMPALWVFVLSQRRAAAVGLVAGFGVVALVLFFRRRRAFLVVVPIVFVLAAGYSALFWNSTDGVGFGARAVKSVLAPTELSARDSASDIYRVIENYNLVYTIRTAPLTGVGFGKPFYQPVKLPDISFFVFYQYIPHNSFLWIWLNMGYLGFVTMLFMIAAALRAGLRASLLVPSGDGLAVTIAALAFVVMFFVFAFVDIAWDSRSCLFLAVCMATCANMLRLTASQRAEGASRRAELVSVG